MQVQTIEYNTSISDDQVRSRFLVNLGINDTLSYQVQEITLTWENPGVVQIYNDGDFNAKIRCPSGRVTELPPDRVLIIDRLDGSASFEITVTEYR